MKTSVHGVYVNNEAGAARQPSVGSKFIPVRSFGGDLMMRRLISLARDYGNRLVVSSELLLELATEYRKKSKVARRVAKENFELSRQLQDARREIDWLRSENTRLRQSSQR